VAAISALGLSVYAMIAFLTSDAGTCL